MTPKIDRCDSDYNTVRWQEDHITIARESRSHVRITRQKFRFAKPVWDISIDATSGHDELNVAFGNRIVCVNDQHVLAITCAEYRNERSKHNYQLHAISSEGQIQWSMPWQTIQRFTMVEDKLLIVRYVSPPQIWIESIPLEAHLIDPETGDSVAFQPVTIPTELLPHYQSGAVTKLKTYLIWKQDQLLLTVRPHFNANYEPARSLIHRGSFKTTLSFE